MSTTIDSLQIEITQNSQQAVNGLDALTASLGRLKAASRGGVGLTAVTNQLKKLNEVVNTMQNPSTKISQLVSALKPLESIGKSNLNSTINSLKKLPEITKQLAAIDMDAFATQINRVVIALKPLADEMNKVAAGFSTLPSRIQRVINQNEKLSTSNVKTGKSFGVMGTGISSLQAKFGVYYLAFRKLSSVVSEWIDESNAYVENLNLFTVAMGQYADEAITYAKKVQDAMGIDMSEWIRNQGIFMQIATAFGVTEEKAYQMSKGLTQVAYDISSFFNIQIADALTKVQSGISGELEPLRRLGYALDAATLQQIAYNHGITQNINTMTQAQKSQLRYIAIMEQSKNVMGDMARTLITPANALRILNQQVVQLKRALGDMIIPLLIKIIPYVQAFVKVITNAARAIATLFGFELPKIDYSGLEGLKSGAEAAENAIGDTIDAVKKLKNMTTGFDELNILSQDDGSSSGAGAGGYDLGVEIKAYEGFLGDLEKQSKEIEERMKSILKWVLAIGAGLAAWKIASGIYTLFTTGLGGAVLPKVAFWIRDVTKALYGMAKGSTAAKSAFSFLTGGTTGLIIAGIAATVALVVARVIDLWKNSEAFRKGLERIGEIAKGVWGVMKDLFGFILDALRPIGEAIAGVAQKLANLIPQNIRDAISGFFKQMNLDWKDLGISALGFALLFVPGGQVFGVIILAFEAITLAIRGLGSISEETWVNIKKWFSDGIQNIKQWFTTMLTDIARFFVNTWNSIQETWKVVANWFSNLFTNAWNGIKTAWYAVGQWFSDLWSGIKNVWSAVGTWFANIFTTAWNGIKTAWGAVGTFFTNLWNGIRNGFVSMINGVIGGLESFINFFVKGINGIISGLNKIQIKMPDWLGGATFGIDIGYVQEVKLGRIPGYANGGFPEDDSLIAVNPYEIVGKLSNGKNVVANNEQIVEGIKQGVYEAVVAAMPKSNEQPLEVKVYLDGKEITKKVEKIQRERGTTLLPGGVAVGW